MNETVPLTGAPESTVPTSAVPRTRRRIGVTVGLVSAVASAAGLTTLYNSREEARKQALIEELHGPQDVGHAWGTDDLYSCSLGEPTVPEEYKNNSWGMISGDWYVIAGNVAKWRAAIGDCPQMKFNFLAADNDGDDASKYAATEWFNQNMMYTADDDEATDYWWNYTGNLELTEYLGVWKNEDGDGDNDDTYDHFWSSVAAVGTYGTERWFIWYFCGPAVTVTKKGIPWVLKSGYSYDDGFKELIKSKYEDLGFLADDDDGLYFYDQSSSCDYKWHHTAEDKERRERN